MTSRAYENMADRYTYGYRSRRTQRSHPPSRARYSSGFWANRKAFRYATVALLAIIFVIFFVSRRTSPSSSLRDGTRVYIEQNDAWFEKESEHVQDSLEKPESPGAPLAVDDSEESFVELLNTQDDESELNTGESRSDKRPPSEKVAVDDSDDFLDDHFNAQDDEGDMQTGEKKPSNKEISVAVDDLNESDSEQLKAQDDKGEGKTGESVSDERPSSEEVTVAVDDLIESDKEQLKAQDDKGEGKTGESVSDERPSSEEVTVAVDDLIESDKEQLKAQDDKGEGKTGESVSDERPSSEEVTVAVDDLIESDSEQLKAQDEGEGKTGESVSDERPSSEEVTVAVDDLIESDSKQLKAQDEGEGKTGESVSDERPSSEEVTVAVDDLNGNDREQLKAQDDEGEGKIGESRSDKSPSSKEVTVAVDDLNENDSEQDDEGEGKIGESHSDKRPSSKEVTVAVDDLNENDSEQLKTQDNEGEEHEEKLRSNEKPSSKVVPVVQKAASVAPNQVKGSSDTRTLEAQVQNLTTNHTAKAIGPRDNLGRAHDHGEEGVIKQELTTGADVEKRDAVKKMMIHAWSNYVQYAWGYDELDPWIKKGSSSRIFGFANIGASIVDSLDTLHVMGLKEEFDAAREWVANKLTFNQSHTNVSVFEFNIRFLGGLLSAYALTGDEVFKVKAVDLAKRLLPAFNTKTGIPCNDVDLNGQSSQWCAGDTSLARLGTYSLEWMYLSNITGDMQYYDKVQRVSSHMQSLHLPHGIPPDKVSVQTGEFASAHVTMGAPGDSFFEYLIKSWLMTGKQDTPSIEMYFKAIEGFEARLLKTTSDGLKYFAQQTGDQDPIHKMDHLACFSAGMFALTALNTEEEEEQKRNHFLQLARDIATTCHESYIRTATGISPEVLVFSPNGTLIKSSNPSYLLRPETVESYFYLWRATHNTQYREWGWDVVQAIEKHCRLESGYIGLRSVYKVPAPTESVQQSYFLAETLKYLYLLFSDDTDLPLDKWVFNTEGHPLPILSSTPHTNTDS